MKRFTRILGPVVALAIIAACGGVSTDAGSSAINADASVTPRTLPSDMQIAARVYDSSFTVPDGFFVDERSGTPRSYTLYHVKDTSLSYDLCTDDFTTAQTWEDADNESRSVNGYYVGFYENERYFEFIRELSFEDDIGNIDDLTSPGFARIFKCSNTNRDGVDRALLDGYAGMLGMRPLMSEDVRTFTEYLWQFTFFPYARKKVLESYSGQTDQSIRHTLLLAFGVNQGTDRCDRIEVARWQFSADRTTGQLTKRFETVHSFEAKLEHGVPRLCN